MRRARESVSASEPRAAGRRSARLALTAPGNGGSRAVFRADREVATGRTSAGGEIRRAGRWRLAHFDLDRAEAESLARDQRECVAVNLGRRSALPPLRLKADATREPARFTAEASVAATLCPTTAHRDLAETLAPRDACEDGFAQLLVEDDAA